MTNEEVRQVKRTYEVRLQQYIEDLLIQFEKETGHSPRSVDIDRLDISTHEDFVKDTRKYVTGECRIGVAVPRTKVVWEEI